MATQAATWGELIDREPLMNEDGSRDELYPDVAAALLANAGLTERKQRQVFLNELLPEIGIASVADLGGQSLTELLEGILG